MTGTESLISFRFLLWRERRALARSEARLRHVNRKIRDRVYDLEHWSFADRPSEYEDRIEEISGLLREYEALGGDALDVLPYGKDHLAATAMPERFVRRQTAYGNRWETHRVEA